MIYLDNAATTFPKPPQVIRAMAGALEKLGANPGRGGHRLALQAGRVVQACREEAARLMGMAHPEKIIFTKNCTEALNLAIAGTVKPGGEVLCSHGEHNAVMRLLKGLESQGKITLRILPPDNMGILQPHVLQRCITPRTCLTVCCHASNVTGVIQPVARLGAVCRENGVPFLVDAAQTAGILPVGPEILRADMVAMPGHKGLLGPHGTGLLALGESASPEPLICGGTGSASESMLQPELLPDRYESGTLNLPGIAGLLQGIRFARQHMGEIHQYESWLNQRFRRQAEGLPGLKMLHHPHADTVGITSFTVADVDAGQIADDLDKCGIAVRGGLHCAPAMHMWLGTLQSGAVRVSPGIYTTEQDIDTAAQVLTRLLTRK